MAINHFNKTTVKMQNEYHKVFVFFPMIMDASQNFCVHLFIISPRLDFLGIKLLGSIYKLRSLIHYHIDL